MLGRGPAALRPRPEVRFPWGSASTASTRFSAAARLAARLMAVVVFPTPPFWFATAMIRPRQSSESGEDSTSVSRETLLPPIHVHRRRAGLFGGDVSQQPGIQGRAAQDQELAAG